MPDGSDLTHIVKLRIDDYTQYNVSRMARRAQRSIPAQIRYMLSTWEDPLDAAQRALSAKPGDPPPIRKG